MIRLHCTLSHYVTQKGLRKSSSELHAMVNSLYVGISARLRGTEILLSSNLAPIGVGIVTLDRPVPVC